MIDNVQLAGAIKIVIERLLRNTGRMKSQLSEEVLNTAYRTALNRRLDGRIPWLFVELARVAEWFGMGFTQFLALITEELDNESNRVVG